jgi:ferrous iron transport protein B
MDSTRDMGRFLDREKIQRTVALVGSPNTGKSTLFNALTGSRQKVANFEGVTVEKVEGCCKSEHGEFAVVDLPGLTSLRAESLDERIALDYLLRVSSAVRAPSTIVLILDGLDLERGLGLMAQFRDMQAHFVVVVNMLDLVHKSGLAIDLEKLSDRLGVPVVGTVASKKMGISELKELLCHEKGRPLMRDTLDTYSEAANGLIRQTRKYLLEQGGESLAPNATFWSKRVLLEASVSEKPDASVFPVTFPLSHFAQLSAARAAAAWDEIEHTNQHWARNLAREVVKKTHEVRTSPQQAAAAVDRWLLHPVFGLGFFVLLMAVLFQAVYSGSSPLMDLIESGLGRVQGLVERGVPEGLLLSFINSGVIAGIGNFMVFLPQILILFAFITVLEDSGYLARASYLMDKYLLKVGLSGKSFIPMLSSFACAVPAIMATRHIPSHKQRVITMIVSPFLTCSARLPVYALLIGAFVPAVSVLGVLNLQGLVFLGLYVAGIVMALAVTRLIHVFWKEPKKISSSVKADKPQFPVYRMPNLKTVAMVLKLRAKVFVFGVGKVILLCSLGLWVLGTFPRNLEMRESLLARGMSEEAVNSERLRSSYLGKMGVWIEPAIEPIGFDWKIGIGILSAFAAREVIISTLGTIYSLGDEVDEQSVSLRETMTKDTWPDGRPVYTLATVLSLLVFFAFAMQCMSTLAVIRREANSRLLPVAVFVGMTLIAYGSAWVTYRLTWLLTPA